MLPQIFEVELGAQILQFKMKTLHAP